MEFSQPYHVLAMVHLERPALQVLEVVAFWKIHSLWMLMLMMLLTLYVVEMACWVCHKILQVLASALED